MFGNYVITALRNILRNRIESLITIGGLALGFAGAIAILFYLNEELSFDDWVKDADQLWRVEVESRALTERQTQTNVPAILGTTLVEEAPEFSDVTRFNAFSLPVKRAEQVFDQRIALLDRNFFDVFGVEFVAGDRASALADNSSIVISEAMAEKYFGEQSPLGQVLTVTFIETRDYRVTGVF